jgi:hypothetical protein
MSDRLQYLLEKQQEEGLSYQEKQELRFLLDMEDGINWRDR